MKKLSIGLIVAIVLGLAFLMIAWPFGTVGAGERGVLLRWGAVTGQVMGEGLYVRVPVMDRVEIMDVKIQKEEVIATAASKDLQTVESKVALNYHIDPMKVANIYQDIGIQYNIRLIDPALQESVKSTTAKYTAEELITRREEVRDAIKAHLVEKLQPRGILIDDFNVVDFQFSASFDQAIELKVTAEQSALAAKNKLEQIKFEAEQQVAEARGKAEALRIESAALQSSPQILQLRALEKWDGRLPSVMGSQATPFVDITGLVR
ncbi:prohibitin family protein [Patescibacteria group bacterium]|jgi:regulator of protease activity HflC (stomatin/prohibitin superfamily)|nr:prohibitin family protein [Patescibacteria group bacterium]